MMTDRAWDTALQPPAETPPLARILVVDDELGIRVMLAAALKREGYEVLLASDGRGALAALDAGPVDVVVTDIRMPHMTGIELLDAARGTTRQVPFPVTVTCATCSGSGAKPGTEPVACATCDGRGRLQQVTRTMLGEFVRTKKIRYQTEVRETGGGRGGAGRGRDGKEQFCRVFVDGTLVVEVGQGVSREEIETKAADVAYKRRDEWKAIVEENEDEDMND